MAIAPDQLRRQRDLSQIVDTSLSLYRRNFGELLAIAAVSLPGPLVIAIARIAISDWATELIVTSLLYIPMLVLGLVVSAAIVRAIADIDEGLPADFYRSFRQVLDRLGDLLLAAVRVIVVPVLIAMTIVGIPFAVYLWIRWSFFSQAVVIENQAPREAISLSERIVKGSWWRTFGILLIVGLLVFIPSGVPGMILAPVSYEASILMNTVMGVIVTPFGVIASTLLFFDLSSREKQRVSDA